MHERFERGHVGTPGYAEQPPSGGFLLIATDDRDADGAAPGDRGTFRLNLTHFDEHGRELYDRRLWAHPPTRDE